MITFNEIYEALRKERYSEQLQALPRNFLQDVSSYLKEKKNISEKDDDMFSDAIIKTKKQFENAVTIFKELMLRRKKKLLNLAFVAAETGISKRDFENMLSFEKEIFESIMKAMEEGDKSLMSFLNGSVHEKKAGDRKMVIFKEDVEKFIGIDGNEVGPFKKGDIANFPVEIIKILESSGKVEVVEDD